MRARVGHLREALDEKYRGITIEEFKNLMVTQILGIDDIKEAKGMNYPKQIGKRLMN